MTPTVPLFHSFSPLYHYRGEESLFSVFVPPIRTSFNYPIYEEVSAMIIAHIAPTGVEKVFFYADSELMENLCLAAWPLVRRELNRLDERLKDAMSGAIRAADSEVSDSR